MTTMMWLALGVCLLVSFMFSGIEAGILSVNRVRLRHRLKMNDPAARKLKTLLARPERLLVTVLLVTNFMNICAMLLVAQGCVVTFGKWGYAVALVIGFPIYLLGLELLPKSLFRRFPYRALALFAELLRITDLILSPLLVVGAWIMRVTLKRRKPEEKKLFLAREDFKYLTIESERQGMLTKVEREMIHNVVDFRSVRAQDVMMPMEKVTVIRAGATVEELLELCRTTDLDRLPVVSDDGRIAGLVSVFEVLFERNTGRTVGYFARRIVSVSPEEEAYGVIRKLRAAHITLAAVLGRDSKPVGVVSSEDLLSRLVKVAVS